MGPSAQVVLREGTAGQAALLRSGPLGSKLWVYTKATKEFKESLDRPPNLLMLAGIAAAAFLP